MRAKNLSKHNMMGNRTMCFTKRWPSKCPCHQRRHTWQCGNRMHAFRLMRKNDRLCHVRHAMDATRHAFEDIGCRAVLVDVSDSSPAKSSPPRRLGRRLALSYICIDLCFLHVYIRPNVIKISGRKPPHNRGNHRCVEMFIHMGNSL